jgi:single-stranded-DNA-specific exonuclease
MKYLWKTAPEVPVAIANRFEKIDPVWLKLLHSRELLVDEVLQRKLEDFLEPEFEKLLDPFIFKDMTRAVERVWKAIDGGERIWIYSDYDADAVTANALLQQLFRYLGVSVSVYIPDRFTEGYGLSVDAFKKIHLEGADVVVTVDCGTNSCSEAEFCLENEIDLIITDHHLITGEIPKAFALVNPKNPEDVYPDHQITGVGVAYKFAAAVLADFERVKERVEKIGGKPIKGFEKWLLDLVAIGTIADCHTLLGENRVMVSFGLKVAAKSRWVGMQKLLEVCGLPPGGPISSQDIGFKVAPRVNAAGRLEHAKIAVDLLVSKTPEEALNLAAKLDEINTRRQRLTEMLVSEAREMAILQGERKVLVVSHPEWQKGLVGLAAGRLANEYSKPVFVLVKGETESTGSGRGPDSHNLVDLLSNVKDTLIKYGGHKQAAGLTVRTDKLEEFIAGLETAAMNVPDTLPELLIEASLSADYLSLDFVKAVNKLQPFGVGNPQPVFLLSGYKVETSRGVGKEGSHWQFNGKFGSVSVGGIGFSMYNRFTELGTNEIDLVCNLDINEWNGRLRLQLLAIDFREATNEIY